MFSGYMEKYLIIFNSAMLNKREVHELLEKQVIFINTNTLIITLSFYNFFIFHKIWVVFLALPNPYTHCEHFKVCCLSLLFCTPLKTPSLTIMGAREKHSASYTFKWMSVYGSICIIPSVGMWVRSCDCVWVYICESSLCDLV